ncbi:sensor histidine kinase, partial [Nonomuraea dietziae]
MKYAAFVSARMARPVRALSRAGGRIPATAFDACLAAVVFFGGAGLNGAVYQGAMGPLLLHAALA